MEELKEQGLILNWGVSNLDTDDMQQLFRVPQGDQCAANQVLYHLGSRGIEYDLLPWLRQHKVPVMAYCPLAQAGSLRRGLMGSPAVHQVAKAHQATPSQILLAFLLAQEGVVPIPRSSQAAHTLENAKAAQIVLTPQELAALDQAFPAPNHKVFLDIV
jgi:diketogulonate reductase-like aldo/keto reductase